MPKQKPDFPTTLFEDTVVEHIEQSPIAPLTFYFAAAADSITPWGTNVARRDQELREFWPTENTLAGAIYSVSGRNAAYKWKIEGEAPKTKNAVEWMLHNALAGQTRGWNQFLLKFSVDFYSQDNGAFIETIRSDNSPKAPVIGIGHLDSGRCTRTGNPFYPVLYMDRKGKYHKLPWWSIIPFSELPSPDETMNDVGISAVTRVLRAAQVLKNLAIYKNEKVSGRFYKAIHFVGGVSKSDIRDIMDRGQEEADNTGLLRYVMPQIVASLDPEKPVSVATIDLAGLPDNFDLDTELKWYITQLALGFGEDYQTFAPLPGGNLGTSTQSEVLHRKSRGKGPALFIQTIENAFKWYGVIPKNVEFKFVVSDPAADKDEAEVALARARARQLQIQDGEITTDVARKLAVIHGNIPEELLEEIPEGYDVAQSDSAISTPADNDTEEQNLRGDSNRIRRT